MNALKMRVLGRIADEIDRYRAGTIAAIPMFNNIWGLFEAAELSGADREDFLHLYIAASSADDARDPSMPGGLGTDADFDAALSRLADWAEARRSAAAEVEE